MSFKSVAEMRVWHEKVLEPYVPPVTKLMPREMRSGPCLVRLWVRQEMIESFCAWGHLHEDDMADLVRERYPCVEEKDIIDYGYNRGSHSRDLYIHNRTMLQLFTK